MSVRHRQGIAMSCDACSRLWLSHDAAATLPPAAATPADDDRRDPRDLRRRRILAQPYTALSRVVERSNGVNQLLSTLRQRSPSIENREVRSAPCRTTEIVLRFDDRKTYMRASQAYGVSHGETKELSRAVGWLRLFVGRGEEREGANRHDRITKNQRRARREANRP